jgi:hypothetical protein
LPSGTSGLASTALAGSRVGTGEMSIRPAPSRPRAARLLPALARRLRVDMLAEVPPDDEGPDGADECSAAAAAGCAARPQTLQ